MWKLMTKITKNLIIAIPVMMISGFVFGLLFDSAFLKGLIIPFTFLMVYPMMVNLNIKKVFEGGDLKAQLLTQLINFGIIPFLAYLVGMIFFRDNPYMALGLLLAGLVPTSGMTISWTGFAKGNLEAAVKMTVIGLVLGSVATPFYVQFLMGAEIEINFMKVMKQIVLIVFIPMIAGFLTRKGLVKKYGQAHFTQFIGPRFPTLSTLGVIGIVFIAMALKARGIAAAPVMLLYILMPLLILYTCNFALSSVVGKYLLPRGDAVALVYGSVMRNLSIALAIAINAFGSEGTSAALVVAIAYIIQVQSAAWYVKFTDRIFGPAEESATRAEKAEAEGKEEAPQPGPMVADIRKILFATDASEAARSAARYACSLGHAYNAPVHIIHVIPDVLDSYSTEAGVDVGGRTDQTRHQEFNKADIEDAQQRIRERIHKTSQKVLEEIPHCPLSEEHITVTTGDPVEKITQTARENGFDLIVMGSQGHGNLFERMVVGSTAQGVMLKSTVPVFVAKPRV